MPLANYYCQKCDEHSRRIFKGKIPDKVECKKCNSVLERQAKGPSSQVVETLDNGVMRKSVTRLDRAEELMHERNLADPSQKVTEYV